MSSSSSFVFGSLPWLCLLVIICVNTPSSEGVQFMCGKKLADTLALVCLSGFDTRTKKSLDPVDYYSDIEDDDVSSVIEEELPFLSKMSSNALTKTRRRRHGVADECCTKPCSMFELRSYCR